MHPEINAVLEKCRGPDRSRTSSRLGETRTDWNAELSEGTQTFPQAARRKIQEDTQLRGECATCGVKQMNGKRLNLKVCQDDPQRTVIYRVGTLVVQSAFSISKCRAGLQELRQGKAMTTKVR